MAARRRLTLVSPRMVPSFFLATAKNALFPYGKRAQNARYHLWFDEASQLRPQAVQQRHSLYRANPSCPTASSGKPLREVFQCALLLPRTNRQLSERKRKHLLHPICVFTYWGYPSKIKCDCQACFFIPLDFGFHALVKNRVNTGTLQGSSRNN